MSNGPGKIGQWGPRCACGARMWRSSSKFRWYCEECKTPDEGPYDTLEEKAEADER
jgi:hypothetical protein